MARIVSNLKVLEWSETVASDRIDLELGAALRILSGRREVYRGRLLDSEIEIVAKCFLPHPKQGRDWRREWDGLLRLEAMKLPAPTPLVACEDSEGTVYVVMEYLEGAVSLGAFIEAADAGALQNGMKDLAELAYALHGAGAQQTDQHIDNWAVSVGRTYLLDAGSYRFAAGPLELTERIQDLGMICATLPPEAERLFRRALISLYGQATELSDVDELDASLCGVIPPIQQARVRRYFKKSQRACTEFGQHTDGEWRGMFAKNADPALISAFFENPDVLMELGERLKSGNTCTVESFSFGQLTYVLKRYNPKPLLTRLRRALTASRARKSWSNSWVLDMSFIPTARAVAFAEEKGFLVHRSFLLMEGLEARLLPEYVAAHLHDSVRVEALVESVGRIWDRLGRIGAAHGDLKATNWMVDASDTVFLIDLDSFRFGLSGVAYERGRKKDKRRFLQNWESEPELFERFCVRLGEGALM